MNVDVPLVSLMVLLCQCQTVLLLQKWVSRCVLISRFLEPSQSLDEGPVHPFKDSEAQLPSVLVEELFSIALLIGRIKNLPANVQSAFTIQHQGKVLQNVCHEIASRAVQYI